MGLISTIKNITKQMYIFSKKEYSRLMREGKYEEADKYRKIIEEYEKNHS